MISRDDAWSRNQFTRRRRVIMQDGREGFAASPEDIIIISKMRYYQEGGSEKHLRDITGILCVQGELVDREYVAQWAKRFQVDEIWDAILSRLERVPDTPQP